MATIGEAVYKISYDQNTGQLNKAIKSTEASLESSGTTSGSKFGTAWTMAAGSLIAKGITKIASTVTNQLDNAISRVDTLKNSQKVFKAMGYSTDSVSDSMSQLNSYLDGLPTSMTSAIQNVQALSASFGGIERGTQVFIDMNNAGLAFGATSAMIDNAILQLGQLSMDGPLDAATWRSLQNSGFAPVFAAMAKEAGVTVGELKEHFGHGEGTVDEFLQKLHQLGTEGGGGMESLSELARKNTNGIGTALENVQNRIGKAVAMIIEHIGSENIANAINTFSSSFATIATGLIAIFDTIGSFITTQWPVLSPILAGITTFLGGLLAMGIATKVVKFLTTTASLVTAHPILAVIAAVALGATLIIQNWEGISSFFGNIFGSVVNTVTGAWNAIMSGAQGAWNFITGIFGRLAGFFGSIFSNAWNAVRNVFSTGGAIFGGIVNGIANVFRGAVNAIIGGINSVVAIPFNAINGALNGLRGLNILGVQPFGWLPSIWVPHIPYLATGGIVPDTRGGRMIVAGEGGQDEWVVPESKMASLIDQINERGAGNITVNVYGTFATSTSEQRKVAEVIAQRIKEIQRSRLEGANV